MIYVEKKEQRKLQTPNAIYSENDIWDCDGVILWVLYINIEWLLRKFSFKLKVLPVRRYIEQTKNQRKLHYSQPPKRHEPIVLLMHRCVGKYNKPMSEPFTNSRSVFISLLLFFHV